VPDAVAAAPETPFCAVHPDVRAQIEPCERCGAFACDACFGLEDERPVTADRLCKSCRDHTGHGEVPWEDASLPFTTRLGQTLSRALSAPGKTFEAIGVGHLYHAGSFAIVTTLVGYAPMLALVGLGVILVAAFGSSLGLPGDTSEVVLGVLCLFPFLLVPLILAVSLFVDLVFAVVFHLTALILGGQGSFESSLRGSLYASAIRVTLAPVSILGFVPIIGPLFSLAARTGMLIWTAFALAGTARRVHRLPPTQAMIAGAMPAILVVARRWP
jgi:hypothetical protein